MCLKSLFLQWTCSSSGPGRAVASGAAEEVTARA